MRARRILLACLLAAAPAAADDACYRNPALALVAGSQSNIDTAQAAAALQEARVTGKDGLLDAARIIRWLRKSFKSAPGGGAFVGKTTAAGMLKSRQLTGCHDWALMLSALLRCAGYPARMVDAAGAQWMAQARSGPVRQYKGHVFVEVFMEGRWILLNSTSPQHIADYDPSNPLIPMEVDDQKGYVVMFKGSDPADYGLGGIVKLNERMVQTAKSIDPAALRWPDYRIEELPPAERSMPELFDQRLAQPCDLDPARRGMVKQFKKAGLDVHIEKSGGAYQAHLYRYGRVFKEPLDTKSFATLTELKTFLKDLERAE